MINEWDHNKIIKVDTAKAEELLIREKIRNLLNLPAHKDFSIIQWQSPQSEKP